MPGLPGLPSKVNEDGSASFLEFVTQTGQPKRDVQVKKLVRKHARNYVSRAKGIQRREPLLQFQLSIPEEFGSIDGSAEGSFPEEVNISQDEFTSGDFLLGVEALNRNFNLEPLDARILSEINEEALNWILEDQVISVPVLESNGASVPKVKRERARKPKARSGCNSCKIRRLKCDASKPSCLRCLTGGFDCEPSSNSRPSANRHSTSKNVAFELSHYCPSVTLQFQDDTEAHYFSVFQSETSVELSGVFTSSFWNGIVLQESNSQPFVRHAVVSIAALNRYVKLLNPAASDEPPSLKHNYEASKQREYALKQYGKALKAMRGISWQERRHLRKVLISTLLVVVFEVMIAQPDMAFTHALIGDRLICNWLYDNPPSQSHTIGLTSPISSVIEDELLLTFGRFDTQLLSFVDHRSLDIHQRGKLVARGTISRMPTVFLDLPEAASYWQVVMRHAGHFLFSAAAATESFGFEKDFKENIAGRALEMNSSTSVYCSPYTIPLELEAEKATFVADVERWSAAFGPLWQQVQRESMDLQDGIAASILRMYSLNTKILLEGTTFTSETSYDIFLPVFQEIVALARFIDSNLQPSYHFHLSTGPPLFVVLLRCRDPTVRREAISILRASNVDGPWNRHMIAKVGEWIMNVEEEGMNDLIGIEDAKRVRLTRLVMGMQEKKVLVQIVRVNRANDGLERNMDWLEETITDW